MAATSAAACTANAAAGDETAGGHSHLLPTSAAQQRSDNSLASVSAATMERAAARRGQTAGPAHLAPWLLGLGVGDRISSPGAPAPHVQMTPVGIFRDAQPLRSVAFNPSRTMPAPGQPLLSAGSNSKALTLLEFANGAETDEETGLLLLPVVHQWQAHHAGSVFCTAWAPLHDAEGTALLATGSNDTTVRVLSWPPHADWPAAVSLHTDAGTVRDVCWLHEGGTGDSAPTHLAASGAGDFGVRVWDVSSVHGSAIPASAARRLLGHTDVVHGLRALGPDGRSLVSCSADGTVRVWDLRARGAVQAFCPTSSTSGASMARLAAAGSPMAARAVTGAVPLHSLAVRGVPDALASSGAQGGGGREVVVGTASGEVAVLDLTTGRVVAAARVHTDEVRCVDAMGHLVLSASFDGTVAVSAVTAGDDGAETTTSLAPITVRRDHRDRVLAARWHPQAPLVVTSSADRSVLLWRIETG
jgi:WD40 repeat protein